MNSPTKTTRGNVPAAAQPPASAGAMIQAAIEKGISPTELTQLYELYEREQAAQAMRAFNQAVAAFKANPPEIFKTAVVDFGNTHFKHARLEDVVDKVTPELCKHGLTVRWDIDQGREDGQIAVKCILSHVDGHSESAPMFGPADASGSKNKIQQIGSTVSYLQRYTLLAVLGLAAKGVDNESMQMRDSAENLIDVHQVDAIQAYILEHNLDAEVVLEYLKAKGYDTYNDLPVSAFDNFMAMLARSANASK